jgi:hypothetical protein
MKFNDEVSESHTIPTRAARLHRETSATRRRRSAWRGRRGLAAALIALLLVASGGVSAYLAMQHARQVQDAVIVDLQQGAGELLTAKTAVVKANSAGGDRTQLDSAITHFQRARADFQRALDSVQSDLVLGGAAIAPGVGSSYVAPRVKTVEAVARMGIALADAGEESTRLDAALLAPAAPGTTSGQKVLDVMTQAQKKAPLIKAALQHAQQEAADVDLQFLPASQKDSLARAKTDIAKGLAQMDQFEALAPAVIELLGGNGNRTYLVLQPDPAELRGGGGFIGSYSLLSANKGTVSLGRAGNTTEIDYPRPTPGNPKYVLAPGPLQQFTHGQSYIVGDSLFLPDFPEAAKTAEKLYTQESGSTVDGVISLDPWAVAALLGVTGPIAIPEWNTTVDAASFPESVFQQQQKSALKLTNRKAFFAAVAARLIERVMALPSAKWSQLVAALNTAVTQRRLQIYVNSVTAQREVDRIGWSGAMVAPSVADETMMEVESNFGGDKVNHWLARSFNLTLTSAGGKLHHALTVSFVNSTPPGYPGGQRYSCYVRFYYPASATGGTISTAPDRIANTEAHTGLNMLDGWFTIDVLWYGSGAGSIRLAWDTSWDPTTAKRIYWQKQAGTLADAIKVTYVVNGKTYTATSDLGQDRVLDVSPNGLSIVAGAAGQAQLPQFGS